MSSGGSAGDTQHVRLVVVHGIGNQKPGSTAARWADAIFRFAEAAGYRTTVSQANFVDSPAIVTVSLEPPADVPTDAAPPTSQFALVEAHWADAFAQPTVGRVLRFLATVAPALVMTQSILIWRHRSTLWPGEHKTARRQAAGHVATLVAPLALGVLALAAAAPLIAVLLLLLLLAASIPVPAVRTFVGKTLGWLSTTIGDAYLFVADPVNRAAMEQRLAALFRKTIPQDDSTTVVLAHSQGAALAYRALQELDPEERPAALITVGSGVGRLQEVGLLRKLPWYLTLLFPLIVGTAAVGLALWNIRTFPLLAISVELTIVAWWVCYRWLAQSGNGATALMKPFESTTWLDIWASFDPVPNGRTAHDDWRTARYQLARVAGEQSIVRDHVRYDRDWDQTMPLIMRRLLAPSDPQRVRTVGVRRPEMHKPLARRDWWGLLFRSVPLIAAAVAIVMTDLFDVGHWIRTAAPGFLDTTVEVVFAPLRSVSEFLEATWPRAPRPQALLGFLVLLALAMAGSIATRRVLTFFQRRETVAWLRDGGFQQPDAGKRWVWWKWALAFVPVVVFAVAVVPLFVSLSRDEALWTSEQTVEAYLTAVAEQDARAQCAVSNPAPGDLDACGTDHEDDLVVCEDARSAIAALPDEAVVVSGTGAARTVLIDWSPEVPPSCKGGPALSLPHRVEHSDEEGWQVTDVCTPPEEAAEDEPASGGSAGSDDACEPL
jgi:hypothetical protein